MRTGANDVRQWAWCLLLVSKSSRPKWQLVSNSLYVDYVRRKLVIVFGRPYERIMKAVSEAGDEGDQSS